MSNKGGYEIENIDDEDDDKQPAMLKQQSFTNELININQKFD